MSTGIDSPVRAASLTALSPSITIPSTGIVYAVPLDISRFGSEFHQRFEGVRRLSLGPGFKHLADRDQRQDHRRGFKIELHHVFHDSFIIAVNLCPCHCQKHDCGIHKGRARSHCDQRVHIGRAVEQALKAADEELLVDHHDDSRKQHLYDSHGHMVAVEKRRQRPPEHHMAHREIHEHQQKTK